MQGKPLRSIGILGGSFNPAHEGHIHISQEAKKRLGLDEIWWLVSPQNPLKPTEGMADYDARVADAQALSKHIPTIRVSRFEQDAGTQYSVDTILALISTYPAFNFVWLMGADNMVQIPQWKNWETLFELVPIAVFDRPAFGLKARLGKAAKIFAHAHTPQKQLRTLAHRPAPAWGFFTLPLHPASATELRKKS
jgi:nicotinate-nucleotide adenylyltransferase